MKGHYPTIPQNTDILGIEVSDNVCYVDFSSAFSDSGIDIPVNTMIYSVVNSLLDTTSADKRSEERLLIKCRFQSKVIQRLS